MNGKTRDPHHDSDHDRLVTLLVREAAAAAEGPASRMPPPDTDTIIRASCRPVDMFRTWAPRVAAAAAVLAVAVGALVIVQPRRTTVGSVPEHLTTFVNSLYPGGDYVMDNLAPVMRAYSNRTGSDYMAGIWQLVLTEIDGR